MRMLPIYNPPNRWTRQSIEYDETERVELEVWEDHSRSILSENDSPDVGFRFSLNPYRGCVHGCAYCYARPTHEYLGLGSGTDFERRIAVKPNAAALLRQSFERPGWCGDTVMMSGVTDCYQPLEARWKLTRACLEVCLEYRNPVHIITKSALVERDLDLLVKLHRCAQVGITISIPFWDTTVSRALEPYAPNPERRIAIVQKLSAAGLRVSVNIAPLIPGLNDADIQKILVAAKAVGARSANCVFLRLPGNVEAFFSQRLRESVPLRVERVLRRLREARGGHLNESRFFARMRGQGGYAQLLEEVFQSTARRVGLAVGWEPGCSATFRRPREGAQLRLLGDS